MEHLMNGWVRLVRFGFRLLYQEMAWSYDVVSWVVSLGEWQKWVRIPLQYLEDNGSQTILEIGHGPGHLQLEIARRGHFVVGLDLSPQMGKMARGRLVRAGEGANLVRGRVQSLPFASGQFDWVISTFPTDYIIDPATLREVYRVLGENGRFLIIPEGHLTGRGFLHRVIDGLFWLTGQRGGRDDLGETAVWQPFTTRLEEASFTVTVKQITFPKSAATVLLASR